MCFACGATGGDANAALPPVQEVVIGTSLMMKLMTGLTLGDIGITPRSQETGNLTYALIEGYNKSEYVLRFLKVLARFKNVPEDVVCNIMSYLFYTGK